MTVTPWPPVLGGNVRADGFVTQMLYVLNKSADELAADVTPGSSHAGGGAGFWLDPKAAHNYGQGAG